MRLLFCTCTDSVTPVVAFGYKQRVRLTPEWPSPEEGILPTACTSLRLPDASTLPQSSRRSGLPASVLVFALDCPDSLSAQEAESALKHEGVVISTGSRSFGGNQDRTQTLARLYGLPARLSRLVSQRSPLAVYGSPSLA